jgi:predicted HAD superfamily Cof-like phosphohydrolase
MNIEEAVTKFHESYNLPIGDNTLLPEKDLRNLRGVLMAEEYLEYVKAEEDGDIVEIADALADIVYIAVGTAIAYGIPFNEVFKEVQRANMSKLDKNGDPIYRSDGKVLKGEDYSPPDIGGILFGAK